MNVEDPYSELGLDPDCSDAEIKAAWRRLAARWHPDRNGSPQALRKIQRINRALEEIRRARAAPQDEPEDDEEPPPAPGGPELAVEVSLEEALGGCTRTLHGTLQEACGACDGSGVEAQPSTCQACGGSGRMPQQLWLAWMPPAKCTACNGHGVARHACPDCEGSGKAEPIRYRCRVDVPAGTRHGEVLRVAVRVQARGARRELALRVRVAWQPHEFFALQEDGTVRCELPVDGFAWMAERWIEVPTPGGLQQMRLKRGFLTYRIKGQGWPVAGGERADCIVTVEPVFPEELGAKQEALVDRLIAANSGSADSEAGRRVGAWQQNVAGWQSRLRR